MQNIKKTVDALSSDEKVDLFNYLYSSIADKGINGDTELAHVNKEEVAILKLLGGSGTVNPYTGLRQYFGGGSKATTPSSQTVTQQATIPPEIAPYITDILGRAQAIQQKRETEGYVPYTGQQIAEFTPEQEKAFKGIESLVGSSQQYFDPATRLTASSAMAPTAESVGQFMSPYMQNVVDIQQREAMRAGDVAQQQLAAGAVAAGGFGGSRQAILEAEQQRNLQQQLGDIQARGLASAYEDAQNRLAQQRARELSAGSQFAGLGSSALQTGLQELGALQQIGGVRQAQTQSALDLAKQQFEAERTYPEQLLQRYSSIIRGYQMDPNLMKSTLSFTPQPSYLQQFAGFGVGAGSLAKAFGAFKTGGHIKKGLASIVVKRKKGGKVVRFQDGTGDGTVGTQLRGAAGTDQNRVPSNSQIQDSDQILQFGLGALRSGMISPQQLQAQLDAYKRQSEEAISARRDIAAEREKLANRMGQVSPAEQELLKYFQQERELAPQRRKEVMAETEAQREALNRAKYFELANVGFRFASPEGGSGGVLSDLVRSLQPSVSEFGKISSAEAGLVRQQRKELEALTDRERDMLAKEADISRSQLDRQLKSEDLRLKVKEDVIGLDLELQKEVMKIEADARKEGREVGHYTAQYLNAITDYQAKLAKLAEVKPMDASDQNALRQAVAAAHGFVIDPTTQEIKMGNQVLTADSALLQNFLADMREGAKVFVEARAKKQEPWPMVNSYLERARASRNEGTGGSASPPSNTGAGAATRTPTTPPTTGTGSAAQPNPANPLGLVIPQRR